MEEGLVHRDDYSFFFFPMPVRWNKEDDSRLRDAFALYGTA
jgi:hypothetical protein